MRGGSKLCVTQSFPVDGLHQSGVFMVHAPEHSCVQARSQKAPLVVDAAVSEQPSAAIMSGQVPVSIAIRIATIVFNVLIL